MVNGFKVITLCGSTRFKEEFQEAQKRLTLEGNIVISVGLFGHSGDDEVWTEGVKDMLDRQHLAKIDLADEIYVINVGGYIGDSTRREIAYGEYKGKSITYLESCSKPSLYDNYAALGELHDAGRISDEDFEQAGRDFDEKRKAAIAEYNVCQGPWPYQWKNIDAVVCGILQLMGVVSIDYSDLKDLYDCYSVWEIRLSSQNKDQRQRINDIINTLQRQYGYILSNAQKLIVTLYSSPNISSYNDELSMLQDFLTNYIDETNIIWQTRIMGSSEDTIEVSLVIKHKYDDWVSRVCSFLLEVGPKLGDKGTHCASFQSKPILEKQPDVVFLGYNPHEEWGFYKEEVTKTRFYEGNPSFYKNEGNKIERNKWRVWRLSGMFNWAGFTKPIEDGNFIFFNAIYFGTNNIARFKRIKGSAEAIEKCLDYTEEVIQKVFKPKCIVCFSVEDCFLLLNNRFHFDNITDIDTAKETDVSIIDFVKSKKSGGWKETLSCTKPVLKASWNSIPIYGIPHPSSSISNNDLGAIALYLRSEMQKLGI